MGLIEALLFADKLMHKGGGGYSRQLRTEFSAETLTVVDDDWVQLAYTVPAALCHSSIADHDGVFSLGFLLSIFDVFSTYLLVAKDKKHRPGVSVTLKGSLVRDNQIRAGEKIHIQCRIKKVGKALGFCDCRVLSPDNGDTIATASHLKFMPMGMLWDFAAGWFFNTITWAASMVISDAGWDASEDKLLDNRQLVVLDKASAGGAREIESDVACGANHLNQFHGVVHGGYICAVLAEIGLRSVTTAMRSGSAGAGSVSPPHLREMEVQFLSPAPRNFKAKALPDDRLTFGRRLMVSASVVKGSRAAAEGTLSFQSAL